MKRQKKLYLLSSLIILAVLIIDQCIKISVKTSMYIGESIDVFSWFKIYFIENNGMAFGWELGGKYFLTSFRIIAVAMIGWYIVRQIKRNRPTGYIVCLSLILAGAAGNIIDCLFYGMWFNDPVAPGIARWVDSGEGYSSIMLGKVVDMFYFPIAEWQMPDWGWFNNLPFIPDAGEHCTFFSAIFNFADAVISCSIVTLLLFYRKQLAQSTGSTKDSGDYVNKEDEETLSEGAPKNVTAKEPPEKSSKEEQVYF